MSADTIGEYLEGLAGHGVYSIEMIENEFGRYGFTYDRKTDLLSFSPTSSIASSSVRLGAKTYDEIRMAMGNDEAGGMLGPDEGHPLVDAGQIAEAVFRLLAPGRTPPGQRFAGRGRSFRADVAAIRELEQPTRINQEDMVVELGLTISSAGACCRC